MEKSSCKTGFCEHTECTVCTVCSNCTVCTDCTLCEIYAGYLKNARQQQFFLVLKHLKGFHCEKGRNKTQSFNIES